MLAADRPPASAATAAAAVHLTEEEEEGITGREVIQLYGMQNYQFGDRPALNDKDTTPAARLSRLADEFQAGDRHTLAYSEAVLLVHRHGHPHVLLLVEKQRPVTYRLPGGRVDSRAQRSVDHNSLRNILNATLGSQDDVEIDFRPTHILSTWYRIDFTSHLFPYKPVHVTRAVERRQQYLVQLPRYSSFDIPADMKLVAVPLFELQGNSQTYGAVLAHLPATLSRFQLHCNS